MTFLYENLLPGPRACIWAPEHALQEIADVVGEYTPWTLLKVNLKKFSLDFADDDLHMSHVKVDQLVIQR